MNHLHTCIAAAALAAAAGPACAVAEATFTVERFHEGPYDSLTDSASDPVRASVATPACSAGGACATSGAVAMAAARADASRLDLGVHTGVEGLGSSWGAGASASSYMQNSFTVHSSSLAAGTPLTLALAIDFSGSAYAELGSLQEGMATLGVATGSTVRRLGEPGEYWQPVLASFDAAWRLAYAGGMAAAVGWGANLQDGYGANGYQQVANAPCQAGQVVCAYSYTRYGDDTAVAQFSVHGVVLDVPVVVGQTYTVYGRLGIDFNQADGLSAADADFSHTLGAAVHDPSGRVSLDWSVPLTTPPVPEPAAWALLAAGLAALRLHRRR